MRCSFERNEYKKAMEYINEVCELGKEEQAVHIYTTLMYLSDEKLKKKDFEKVNMESTDATLLEYTNPPMSEEGRNLCEMASDYIVRTHGEAVIAGIDNYEMISTEEDLAHPPEVIKQEKKTFVQVVKRYLQTIQSVDDAAVISAVLRLLKEKHWNTDIEVSDGKYVVEKQVKYTYDSLNQLVREDNQFLEKSITYTYDVGGNITSKSEYDYTTETTLGAATKVIPYTYTDNSWKDKMSTYNGQTITYDNMGNPLQYRDGMAFTWQNGRELAALNKSGTSVSFKYNDSSIRTSKTVNGVTTKYYLNGDSVITEITGNERFDYFYDENGDLYGFNYQSSPSATPVSYYYIRNGQNDIIGILDSTGNQVVSYEYDTWGKLVSIRDASGNDKTADTSFIGYKNPYRYRGYRYDSETGLYYLNSRYYDPETGRFINADEQINDTILGANVYIFCENNPVNLMDSDGLQPRWASVISSMAKGTLGYKTCVYATQHGMFKKIFYAAGFFRDSKGVYHTRQDCLQQYGGYNDFYDWAFNLGTDMQAIKFPFSYGGTDYILWAWKGDYLNLGAGAELGIYYGGGPQWLVDTSLAMPMSLQLRNYGLKIISYSAKAWWINGFNPYIQNASASHLTAIFTINFSGNKGMFNAFYGVYHSEPGWTFNIRKHTATLTF